VCMRPPTAASHTLSYTTLFRSALLREMGADVAIGERPPDRAGGPDVVLLLSDLLDEDDRRSLDSWVDAGGRLVVTDPGSPYAPRSEEHTSELQSRENLVCRLLL